MDDFNQSSEQNAHRNKDSKGQAHKASVGYVGFVGNWTRSCVGYTLTKYLFLVCLPPWTLTKWSRLINLEKIQAVTLILLDTFSQIYSENLEQKAEQSILKNLKFWFRKTNINTVGTKGGVGLKRLVPLKWNKGHFIEIRIKIPLGHFRNQ